MKTQILSDEEIQQFKKVLEYSQNIDNPKVEELLEIWERKKSYFIKQFGGLVKEIPNVVFTLDASAREERINTFLDRIERRYRVYDLVNFIELNRDGFYSNEVVTDKYVYNGVEIPKGMKLVRAFKYFLGDDKCILTDIQNDASRVIQEDKIEGTLCFSVHPLDFLSASENTHNWRSCHALDGEYRGGNLSYMVDECTFMCYLRSDGFDYQLPNFPYEVKWNSKKWRVYLFLAEDKSMLMAGRQYPFSSTSGMERVLKEIFIPTLLQDEYESPWFVPNYKWSEWRDDRLKSTLINGHLYAFNNPLYPIGGSMRPLSKFVKDLPGSLHFNDLRFSSCYEPIYAFLTSDYVGERTGGCTHLQTTKFKIGGGVPCLNCGQNIITHNEEMVCDNCYPDFISDDGWYCDNCDCHMDEDEPGYYVEGYWICEDCYENNAENCCGCGESYFTEHMHYIEQDGEVKWYCNNCWEEIEKNG